MLLADGAAGELAPSAVSGRVSAAGASDGVERTPLPLSATVAGAVGKSLLLTVSVLLSEAAVCGAKSTPSDLDAPAASVNGSEGSAGLKRKSLLSESVMPLTLSVSLPVLVITTPEGAELVPLPWFPKAMAGGCTESTG